MPTWDAIGGAIAFLVYAYLLYRQNKIMEETNEIMREQGGKARSLANSRGFLKKHWPMVIMAVLTFATWSAVGLFIYLRKPVAVEQTYEFAWQGDKPQSKQVAGKRFANERVVLDDTRYVDCEFTNVTFVYNGTAPFYLKDSKISRGFLIATDNPSINADMMLLSALGVLSIPGISKDTGKPPTNIEQPRYINPTRPHFQ